MKSSAAVWRTGVEEHLAVLVAVGNGLATADAMEIDRLEADVLLAAHRWGVARG
eukprot:COSAG06_NODE_31324_length_521_cov_1.094340_2_plen_53_part_01